MENQKEFFFNKKKIKRSIISSSIFTSLSGVSSVYFLLKFDFQILVAIVLIPGLCLIILTLIRSIKKYQFTEPVLIFNSNSMIYKEIGLLNKINQIELNLDEIETICTEITKEKGNTSTLICFKLTNSKESKFNFEEFELTHGDIYNIIKELKPDAKILNIGEWIDD